MRSVVLPQDAQSLAVHACLLHTGKIIYFGGDEHDKRQHDTNNIDHTRLFDCATGQISKVPSPEFDVFCCGHCMLADGRLLVAGGTADFEQGPSHHHGEFLGLRDTAVFDPLTNLWTKTAVMNFAPGKAEGGGRWYPTLVTLPNGDALAMAGKPSKEDIRRYNDSPERFSPLPAPQGVWHLVTDADPAHALEDYPRLFVLPDGAVFNAMQIHQKARNFKFYPDAPSWVDVCPAPSDIIYNDHASTAVLLPLLPGGYAQPRILLCGGRQPLVLELNASAPAWKATLPRTLPGSPQRRYASAVLLPTGEVFVCGGVAGDDNLDGSAVLPTELFTLEGDWRTLEPAVVARNYHSVALLMPDGRVWTAGSNHDAKQSFEPGFPPQPPGWGNRELRIEIFEPDYIQQPRPEMHPATRKIRCGDPQRFLIASPQAKDIRSIALLRTGAVTHAFNSDQRYIGLDYEYGGDERLLVMSPPDTRVAPPGYYLLFIIDMNGVPSVGKFVQVLAP